jgi:hypothetical protein
VVDQVNHAVEELHDVMDFVQEIFECDNREVSDILSNSLLYFCYLPAVLGSIPSETKPILSISTAEYVLVQTFARLKYQPFINTIVGCILLDKIPRTLKREIFNYHKKDPISYRSKWVNKLPS